MTWNPQKQVIDLVPVVGNLLTYIETHDADALLWANGGTALAEFAKFYTSARGRLSTIFPSLMALTQESSAQDAETEGGDVLVIDLSLTLEATLDGPDADELILTTKKYAYALESMLENISAASLISSSNIVDGFCKRKQTVFDIVRQPNNYLQIFQTRVDYRLIASKY